MMPFYLLASGHPTPSNDDLIEQIARALRPGHFETFDQGFPSQNFILQGKFLNAEKVVRRARKDAQKVISALTPPCVGQLREIKENEG